MTPATDFCKPFSNCGTESYPERNRSKFLWRICPPPSPLPRTVSWTAQMTVNCGLAKPTIENGRGPSFSLRTKGRAEKIIVVSETTPCGKSRLARSMRVRTSQNAALDAHTLCQRLYLPKISGTYFCKSLFDCGTESNFRTKQTGLGFPPVYLPSPQGRVDGRDEGLQHHGDGDRQRLAHVVHHHREPLLVLGRHDRLHLRHHLLVELGSASVGVQQEVEKGRDREFTDFLRAYGRTSSRPLRK